ncbi:hypothetical protein J437_LFUL019526, partial [Ladona fulva]
MNFNSHNSLYLIPCGEKEVLAYLDKLSKNPVPGADCIPGNLLSECKELILKLLVYILNESLRL